MINIKYRVRFMRLLFSISKPALAAGGYDAIHVSRHLNRILKNKANDVTAVIGTTHLREFNAVLTATGR